MKLAHVELWNWRNFAHVEFNLNTRLFVVGPNASGKSNLLDAMRFVFDVAKTGLREAAEQRGGIRALSNGANGTSPARLAFSFEAGPERRTYELDLSTDRAEDAGSQDIRDYFTGIHYIHPNPVKMLEQGPYDECGTGFTRHAASLPNTVLERAITRIRPVLAAVVPEVPYLSHVRIGENDDIIFYSDDPPETGRLHPHALLQRNTAPPRNPPRTGDAAERRIAGPYRNTRTAHASLRGPLDAGLLRGSRGRRWSANGLHNPLPRTPRQRTHPPRSSPAPGTGSRRIHGHPALRIHRPPPPHEY